MSADKRLLQLVGLVYEAAGDSRQWQHMLETLATTIKANSASLQSHDFASSTAEMLATVDIQMVQRYEEYYAPRNIVLQRGASLIVPGKVVTAERLCPKDDFLGSEYYNDFLRPQKIYHMMGGSVVQTASVAVVVTLTRPRFKPAFDQGAERLVQALMPHMKRAFEYQQRISGLEGDRDHLADTLDRLAFGVVIVDRNLRVLSLNHAAEEMLARKDGIALGSNGLHIANRAQHLALQSLVWGAADTAAGRGLGAGGAVSISRPSLQRPYTVLVTPARPSGHRRDGTSVPAASLFITDPALRPELQAEALIRIFDLTPAETRLAKLLSQGKSLDESADELGVTKNTVHSQLAAIFQKTGTRRQMELVRLLIGCVPPIRLD